jgi:hypothetical protein
MKNKEKTKDHKVVIYKFCLEKSEPRPPDGGDLVNMKTEEGLRRKEDVKQKVAPMIRQTLNG